MQRQWVPMSLMLCALLAPHCSSESPTPTGEHPESDAGVDAAPGTLPPVYVDATSVCLSIGPEGGSFTHPSGAQLVVPSGALAASTSLCLKGIAPPSTVLGSDVLAQAFEATPSGQTFYKPVTIAIPFDATRVRPGADLSHIQIAMAPQGSTDFAAVGATADLAHGLVRAETSHFTQFVPVLNPNPVFIPSPTSLANGTVGVAYAQTFTAAGGTSPYTWSIAPQSAAPTGLSFNAQGVLGGVPTAPNNYPFFVVATDAASHSVQVALSLTISLPNNPVPAVAQISPATVPQGSSITTLSISGSGFAPSAQAAWDGAPLATTFVSTSEMAASLPASSFVNAGTHQITVVNPAPGGGASAPATFTVTSVAPNPVPTIASITPAQVPVSNVDTQIAITGTGFVASSKARIGPQALATSFVSATLLNATIPASRLATPATLQIGVSNPAPGGGSSPTTVPLVVGSTNAVPTLAQVTPSTLPQGSPASTLTLTGTQFASSAQGLWDGAFVATTYVSETELTIGIPAGDLLVAGSHSITVSNPAPGGGTSGSVSFVVTAIAPNPVPTIASIAPSSLTTTNVDTQITITGTGFIPSTSAAIAAQGISTTYVSDTQLLATIPGTQLSTPSTLQIGVYSPPPGGGFSATTVPLSVTAPNAVPTLTSISPTHVVAGGASFDLVATGTSFAPGAQIFWGSTALATTVSSATSAKGTVPASLLTAPGSAAIVIVNPAPGGGTSAAQTFTIDPTSSQPTPFPGGWTSVAQGPAPPAIQNAYGMATLGSNLVLFAAYDRLGNPVSETWSLNGTAWTKQSPTSAPSARQGYAMATLGARIVLFGGYTNTAALNDTWQWDGVSWTLMAPTHSPPGRIGHGLASLGNKVILFGGVQHQDTWSWDGTDWTQISTGANPGPRSSHGMATLGSKIVLFGGYDSAAFGDTWTFDGASWAKVSTTGPSPRWSMSMATLGDAVVMFGGGVNLSNPSYLNETWRWDGSAWAQLAPSVVPSSRQSAPASTLGGAMYFFGGTQDLNAPGLWKAQDTCVQGSDCALGFCNAGNCCPQACTASQSCAIGICSP